jgi:hypothetical protein
LQYAADRERQSFTIKILWNFCWMKICPGVSCRLFKIPTPIQPKLP